MMFNLNDAVKKIESPNVWKVGTIVEIGTGHNAGRVRVLWSKVEWIERGTGDFKSQVDGKRTWVALKSIQKI